MTVLVSKVIRLLYYKHSILIKQIGLLTMTLNQLCEIMIW